MNKGEKQVFVVGALVGFTLGMGWMWLALKMMGHI